MPSDPTTLADDVFHATVHRRRLVLHSRTAKLAYVVSRACPARYERMMARRIMPGAGAEPR